MVATQKELRQFLWYAAYTFDNCTFDNHFSLILYDCLPYKIKSYLRA